VKIMHHSRLTGLKHSGRRAFLRLAGGAALALPLLELTHGKAWSQDLSPKRFLTLFSHGGTISNQASASKLHDGNGDHIGKDYWKPADPGEDLVLGPIHEQLEPWRQKLLVLQGIDNRAGVQQGEYGGGHGYGNVTALTAADVGMNGEDPVALGPSIDFVLADRLAALYPAKFKRIHLKVGGHQYGTPYFSGSGQTAHGEESPLAAFDTIFEGVTADPEPDPALVKKQLMRRSVLEGAMDGYKSFQGIVSQSDLYKIEAHLEHLHTLEQELLAPPVQCDPPVGIETDDDGAGDVVGSLHVKIILAALRCGLTNVANLEIADILCPWTPAYASVESGFGIGHSLHHMARDCGPTGPLAAEGQAWLLEMTQNRQWRMSLLKELLEGLDDPAFVEGGGTMLDNSLLLFTSEFSNGSQHICSNQPVLLAGSAGGYFQTGRHLNYNSQAASNPNTTSYATNESTHNLFTSILQAFGGDDVHFGSGDALHEGPLPSLT
jgi:hypothetical protein